MPNRYPPTNAQNTVLHVVNTLEGGGTEHTLIALLADFDPQKFRHRVVTLRACGRLATMLPDHVGCCALDARGSSRRTALQLARIIRTFRPSIVHARNTGTWFDATVATRLAPRTPLVLGYHGLTHAGAFPMRSVRIARIARHFGASFASVSQSGRRQLMEQMGIPSRRITVVRNGVKLATFAPCEASERIRVRRRMGIGENAFVVGSVGSLTPVKGYSTLIDATARALENVPNLHLVLIGSGPLKPTLQAQATTLGISHRVHLTGWSDAVPEGLNCLDTYVCSSVSEAMNNALLQALAVGIPIIATDAGDNPTIVRDGREGLIVPVGDAAALAQAMLTLAADPELRCRLAVAARVRAGHFAFTRTVQAYEDLYEGVLNERTSGRPIFRRKSS